MIPDANRLEAIFASALAKASLQERAAYLDEACAGDAELRRRLEALLEAHDKAGSFLEKPAAAEVVTTDLPGRPAGAAEGPGTRIGPYKLLQQIGEGGMGVVYMAEQEHPVKRRVALKIIKPGMDSRQVIARFEAERQALAMMDHPNIARVLDAGTTESGRPYFVMELVYGVPITKFCDDHQLNPRQRLELFVPVCQAIQHAHQKGIIHRDVKPSNVLVTMHDDKPVPKVIDFGVAKAVEQRLTEKTLFTQFGAMVGTLEYMSPEQAEMNAFGVDTRSDVYSLGVLLYELLTGTTPLERKRLREAAYTEVLHLIKEMEPPRPSVRLSSSGDLPKIAAARKTEPAHLPNLLRGEIDWIVMRCLEKDRTRRYESASALARDIERHLRDEAVEACPPSAAYRLRKFARKNRVVLSTAAAFVALLVIAAGVSAWLAVQARRAEATADEKRGQAEMAEMQAGEERNRAQAEWRRAEGAAEQARASAAQTRRALDRLTVARGIQLAEEGNLFAALPWFVKPLEHGELTPQEEQLHRARLGFFLRHTTGRPILRQVFFTDGPVRHAAWSTDGKRVLTGTNALVQVWDVRSGAAIATLRHPAFVETAQFTPDGTRVLATVGSTVWMWDARSGRSLGPPLVDWGACLQHPLSLLPQTPWQFVGNVCAGKVVDAGWEHIESAEISRDGRRVLFEYRRFLRLVDIQTRKPIQQWWSGRGETDNHALSPDGERLLLIRDGRPAVHCTEGGKAMPLAIDPGSTVKSATFSPDGSRAVTAGKGGTRVWDARTWDPLTRIGDGTFYSGDQVRFSPDNRFLARWDFTFVGMYHLALWDVASGRLVRAFDDLDRDLQGFDWSPDGRQFLRVSRQGEVRIWNNSSPESLAAVLPHGSQVTTATYGPDARMLLTAGEDGEVRIWDLGHATVPFVLQPPEKGTLHSSMQMGYALGGGSHSRTFTKIIPAKGANGLDWSAWPYQEAVARLLPPGTLFQQAVVSPDQGRVLTSHVPSSTATKELRLWDARTKRRLGKALQTESVFNCAAFSPDSRFVVVGSEDGTARLVDAGTGERTGSPLRHGGPVLYAAFSPDGEVLVTCGSDRTARLWSTRTGQPIGDGLRHDDEVTVAAFSVDGQTVATAALDATVRLWDRRGTSRGILKSKSGLVRGLQFHPSGLLLVAFFNDTMRMWDMAAHQEMGPLMEGFSAIQTGGETQIQQIAYGKVVNPGFDLPSDDRPAEDLVKLSQLYSGRRLDTNGGTVALPKEERRILWRELSVRFPKEFAVSPKAAVEWRIGQLQAASKAERSAAVAFARRWLAAELAEVGWQPGDGVSETFPVGEYLQRLSALAPHGRHIEAAAAADALAARSLKDPETLYGCACVHALAAGAVIGDAPMSERYAARAVALLRQAVEAGHRDSEHLRKDSELDSLRRREDFRELLKKLDAKKP
jgi:serine/threonine protein kinase/WD40 repeat protein